MDFQAGKTYDLNELPRNLERNGYARTTLVEGVGQFALRGGILDVFSPAYPQPLRVEFFGDDLDIMGFFDVSTQRRTENVENAVILPVAETQPRLHPQGMEGLCNDIEKLLAKQKRRKNINEQLIRTLEQDLTLLRNNVSFAASDRYMALIYPQLTCANDYVSRETLVFFNDFGNLVRHEKTRVEQQGLMLDGLLGGGQVVGELCDFSMDLDSVFTTLKGKSVTYMDNFLATRYPEILPPKVLLSATAKQLPSYGGSLETAAEDLRHYQKNDFGTLVLCGNRRRGELLLDMLREKGLSAFASFQGKTLPAQGQILLVEGNIPAGMEYPDIHLAVLSEGQILQTAPRKTQKNSKKAATNRKKLSSFTDLSPGDLVVHERYGIGRFVAIEPIRLDGVTRDYVKVAYGGSDVLYVPATQLDVVSKYIGGGEDAPVKLNRLSGDQWQKTKAKARAAAKDMAAGLIKLYAQRQKIMGYPFAADTPWQAEFEESFPFAETDDQLRCIADIKSDMESHLPMDRLLCGDVGFGKTEVALRAAMKAILDGKQVALLVPTTVLAQQHFLTAKKRFSGFPVNITVISRFSTPKQVKNILFELKSGKTDMLIGTHKLLQKDVIFKDMGLLIVDEEQRFGVSHKERLKEISVGVDVLTLSATPIPRTLNMALSGIRDMSTIEEPPQDRHPVQTFVLEHNDMLLDDAIGRELSRGGQVYYLHNRVESIEACAAALKKRLPNATIGVAHGKLTEAQLSQVMEDMNSGDVQILVCTTIIETGIDISNVNTLIIENADRFGLSQLHQLRGRVGRSNRHAFCYLTYKKGKVLTEVADKRLSAIRDFAEFGSGFKIAMRDLEIRG
ncbi:MAG: transcription-repair coupling factor, partial [Eubacteriales bacterium]